MKQKTQIVILNFGSQFAHLIARRVRELGVYAEIVPHDISSREIKKINPFHNTVIFYIQTGDDAFGQHANSS